jgi:hypothetical protein
MHKLESQKSFFEKEIEGIPDVAVVPAESKPVFSAPPVQN